MKLKTLKKKIRRLEKRLREGPAKLARLNRDLTTLEKEKKATASARREKKSAAAGKEKKSRLKSATARPAEKISEPPAPAQPKRVLNLSPERRAQLSAAMKARWAARKAAAAPAQSGSGSPDAAPPESAPPNESKNDGF